MPGRTARSAEAFDHAQRSQRRASPDIHYVILAQELSSYSKQPGTSTTMETLPNVWANAASRSNTAGKALACYARGPAREQLLAARNKAKELSGQTWTPSSM